MSHSIVSESTGSRGAFGYGRATGARAVCIISSNNRPLEHETLSLGIDHLLNREGHLFGRNVTGIVLGGKKSGTVRLSDVSLNL